MEEGIVWIARKMTLNVLFFSVTNADGKRHRLFFLVGKGLINGWTLLAEALQGLGVKTNIEEKRKPCEIKSQRKEEFSRGGLSSVFCRDSKKWSKKT